MKTMTKAALIKLIADRKQEDEECVEDQWDEMMYEISEATSEKRLAIAVEIWHYIDEHLFMLNDVEKNYAYRQIQAELMLY